MRWGQRLRDRLQALSPREILTIGFAVFLVWAFPGYMSTDSIGQLEQARSGQFSDGHPPLMAAQWWLLDRIVSGPLLMLLLQSTLFLGGLYFLLRRLLSPTRAAWTAIAIMLYPPVLTTMAVIWKDSQMAAYLVAGTAALVQPRLRIRILGLVLLAFACASRHNALAAAVPIVGILFEWRNPIAWWKRLGIMVLAAVLAMATLIGVSRLLAVHHVKLTPVFSDIVGVIAYGEQRSDEQLREVLRGTPLFATTDIQARARKVFFLGGQWRTVHGEDRVFDSPTSSEHWDALDRAWKELVLGDPVAYLAAHWHIFAELLGLYGADLRAPVWNLFLDVDVMMHIEHNASHSWMQAWLGHAFYWLANHTPLFRPFVYALIGLALLALCCRDRLTFALLTSGLLYEVSFFPVNANPDHRYSHWMITSVCIATVILFVQRWRASRA